MRHILRLSGALLLIGATGVVACSGPEKVTGKQLDSATIVIKSARDTTASADTLVVGDRAWFFVGGVDTTAATVWSVSDTSVARIIPPHIARVQVHAVGVGNATLMAQLDGATATFPIVVRELQASDTMVRVSITTKPTDSTIVGDTLPFGFDLMNRRGEHFFDYPFSLSFSDSTVARAIPFPPGNHSFWIEALKLGQTVLRVTCECVSDSITITIHEPPRILPDPRANRFDAIDLGTLGGGTAIPLALNDSGDVVGYSLTSDGKQHAFLWRNGVMRDLSSAAETHSAAFVVSNGGAIAGTSMIGGEQHIILWQNEQATDLGPVSAGDPQARVVGITATAVVARGNRGSAIWQNGVKHFIDGFRAEAMNSRHQIVGTMGQRPYIWDNGSMMALEIRGLPSHAVDINSDGVVVGDTPTYSTWGIVPSITVWVQGQISRILAWIPAVAINDHGDAVGQLGGSAALYPHGADHGLAIPSLGGGPKYVKDLNDRAMVVGSSWTVAKKQHAFLWQPGESTSIDLGTGPITTDRMGSAATALNARGDIIGWVAPCTTPSGRCTEVDTTGSRAVLWRLKSPRGP